MYQFININPRAVSLWERKNFGGFGVRCRVETSVDLKHSQCILAEAEDYFCLRPWSLVRE